MLNDLEYGQGLLVIVGAGASSDSLPTGAALSSVVGTGPPPLTKDIAGPSELSNRLAGEKYPNVGPIIGELRRRLRRRGSAETLEEILREYLTRAETNLNIRRHIAAMRYYLRDLLDEATRSVLATNGGITNYTYLVSKCYQWAADRSTYVCFVSFNYDYLLENACQREFFFDPSSLRDYVENPLVSVLKPHGSVLWATGHPDLEMIQSPEPLAQVAIDEGEPTGGLSREIISGSTPPLLFQTQIQGVQWGNVAYPALALPMAGKTDLVWPNSQNELFTETLHPGSFGRVLIVGWRAAEAHFTGLLTRLIPANANVMVVSESKVSGEETVKGLTGAVDLQAYPRIFGEPLHAFADTDDLNWLLN